MLKLKYVVLLILWLPSIVVAQGYSQADVEELLYAKGMAQTQGLQEYLETRLNVDLKYKSWTVQEHVSGPTRKAIGGFHVLMI